MGADRISSLPSAITGHILSFIPTKEAVSTSILSTKWKYTWHSITKLDLNDDNSSCPLNFTTLMYRLLLRRKGLPLNDLKLSCEKEYNPLHVNEWIDAALWCNIKHLDVSIFLDDLYTSLYIGIFSSVTLVVLKLSASFVMNVPSHVSLPCLKVVDLTLVRFLDEDSITRFICGSPVLEELNLSACIEKNIHNINIVSPRLTRLVLKDMPIRDPGSYTDTAIKCKIMIDTPSLIYLEMKNYFAQGYLVKDFHNLVEAHINIFHHYRESPSDDASIYHLLNKISNVQTLQLTWRNVQNARQEFCYRMPKFLKLTWLEFITDRDSTNALTTMLQNSPCLETFLYGRIMMAFDFAVLKPIDFHCRSLSTNLKVVKIEYQTRLSHIGNMVLFFLNNAKDLENLIVETGCMGSLEDAEKVVKCFLKNQDNKIKKLTMEKYKNEFFRLEYSCL